MQFKGFFEWSNCLGHHKLSYDFGREQLGYLVTALLAFNLPRLFSFFNYVWRRLFPLRRSLRYKNHQRPPEFYVMVLNKSPGAVIDTNQPFQFNPLETTSQEIRLLHLHRGEKDGPIYCQLRHVSLGDQPRYVALSHVWGPSRETCPILLNGKCKYITPNLFQALQHLRNAKTEISRFPFWIDAICIGERGK